MAKPMRVVFVLDTSASMRGPLNGSLSALDAAKAAIDQFVSSRARMPIVGRQDHYALVTSEGPQTAWNASTEDFLGQMRQTRYGSSASIKDALDASIEFVNRHRSPLLDNYGQGFVPWFIMPCSFIILTDGTRDISLPQSLRKSKQASIQHYYSECYRWDHRIHVAVLTTGGVVQTPLRLADCCQITCGTFKVCSSLRALREFMELLAQRTAPSILVRLVSNAASASCPFFVNQDKGNWPIPLPFLPDSSSSRLENCCPIPEFILKPVLTPIDVTSLGLPYDRYEAEAGQFPNNVMPSQTQQVLCHVRNSLGDETDGKPFAILKATTLFVLPYNFPRLSRLVQESTGASLSQQLESWRLQLEVVPFYYLPALRMACSRTPHLSHLFSEVLLGEIMAGCLNSQIKSQINRLIQLQQSLTDVSEPSVTLNRLLPRPIPGRRPQVVIDPAHRIPVSVMGNYQTALASKVVLRNPFSDDTENGEQLREDAHFGSRYRKTKKVSRRLSLSVDEADSRVDDLAPASGPRFRETIVIQDADLLTSKAEKRKVFVNHWNLASLFWSFTDLLLVSDFDPAYSSLLSNFKTVLETARSNADFDILLQLCQEQATRYGNPNRMEVLRSGYKSTSSSKSVPTN